mmetsp:Transcript_21776/g.64184  ORF Transcript_21776/g.64184 Transcript_21776/m.64184 type:complete len:249 (+) Transcript_21776:633-1379(+)
MKGSPLARETATRSGHIVSQHGRRHLFLPRMRKRPHLNRSPGPPHLQAVLHLSPLPTQHVPQRVAFSCGQAGGVLLPLGQCHHHILPYDRRGMVILLQLGQIDAYFTLICPYAFEEGGELAIPAEEVVPLPSAQPVILDEVVHGRAEDIILSGLLQGSALGPRRPIAVVSGDERGSLHLPQQIVSGRLERLHIFLVPGRLRPLDPGHSFEGLGQVSDLARQLRLAPLPLGEPGGVLCRLFPELVVVGL